jgi:hypothetical protein
VPFIDSSSAPREEAGVSSVIALPLVVLDAGSPAAAPAYYYRLARAGPD